MAVVPRDQGHRTDTWATPVCRIAHRVETIVSFVLVIEFLALQAVGAHSAQQVDAIAAVESGQLVL